MEDERSVDSRFEFDSSYEREESDRNWMRNGKECRKKTENNRPQLQQRLLL